MSTEAGEVAVRPGAESLAEDAIDTVASVECCETNAWFPNQTTGPSKPWRSTETMAKH